MRELNNEGNRHYEAVWKIVEQTADSERRAAKAQIIPLLRKELHGLSPILQEAVTSYYGHDYSLQEAADALGISVAAVKSRLLRGRRSLRLSFERKGLLDSHV